MTSQEAPSATAHVRGIQTTQVRQTRVRDVGGLRLACRGVVEEQILRIGGGRRMSERREGGAALRRQRVDEGSTRVSLRHEDAADAKGRFQPARFIGASARVGPPAS